LHQLPLETWMVVNVTEPKWDVVSLQLRAMQQRPSVISETGV
jgi:hypothetical protein